MSRDQQNQRISNGNGFIAALDQSGGSTPKALKQYGVEESAYSNEEEMYSLVHEMRTRIITSQAFNGDKIIGAILFEKTMDGMVENLPTAQYLWEKLSVVPFLKVDKGLADEEDGVQLMKPMPDLDALLDRAKKANIYGTKMRSVINSANASGIKAIVSQQFEVGNQILDQGLMPIIEPEVNIHASDKQECEALLKSELLDAINALPEGRQIMLKLTLPEQDNLYADLISHKNVLRVVALSGGYDLEKACDLLARNNGMIASFSRALTNNLTVSQSDEDFNQSLQHAIDKIYTASVGNEANTQAA